MQNGTAGLDDHEVRIGQLSYACQDSKHIKNHLLLTHVPIMVTIEKKK